MMSDQDAIDKAVEAAKKLASSTNSSNNPPAASSANSWQQYGYPFPSYVPAPTFGYGGYGYGDYGMQGMNFASPASQPPAAIPQMNGPAGSTAPPLPRPLMNFNQPPPPPSSSATGNSNNSKPFNSFGTQPGLSAYEQWRQSRQQNQQQPQPIQQQNPGGPKPIRFSLQPKRPAGKNQFNSNNNPNLEPLGNINKTNNSNLQAGFGLGSSINNVNVNSRMYEEDGRNNQQSLLKPSNASNADVNSLGYSGGSTSQQQSWSGYSAVKAKAINRTPLLPTPLLSKPKNTLTQQQIISAMDPSDWPPSLQEYVYRCYALCANDMDKDRVDIILKGKVIRAASDSVLQSKDWSKEPLPEISDGQIKMLPFAPLSGPIKGKITGKPIKPDIVLAGRGAGDARGRRGRGGRGGLIGKRGKDTSSRGRGAGGSRNNFRSRSRSSSRSSSHSGSSSRSSSNSSRSSSIKRRSTKRRRRSSPSPDYYNGSSAKKGNKGKTTKKKNKRANKLAKFAPDSSASKPSHMYSEYGIMQVDDECISTEKMSARAARFARENASGRGKLAKLERIAKVRPAMKSRLGGFAESKSAAPVLWAVDTNPSYNETDWAATTVTGTCGDLEKQYFRLTTAPDPTTIRPVSVLKKSLEMVKRRWREDNDYRYACDQLKSIRQDLTVQRVRNTFTVSVYEVHARIALEKGDHEEFNQCQSQLVQLYQSISSDSRVEFTAYRILYYVFTANTLDLGTVMSKLTEEEKTDECISHALQVRSAWALKNYPRFFKLHRNAPRMAGHLIDWFANRERKHALKAIMKVYRPNVPTSFVKQQLGLSLDSEWTDFLSTTSLEHAIVYVNSLDFDSPINSKINCKDSYPLVLAALPQK